MQNGIHEFSHAKEVQDDAAVKPSPVAVDRAKVLQL